MVSLAIGGQIHADRCLLKFKDYEDYLDSLVTAKDLCYLRSTITARFIAELGYRNSGETLTRDEYHRQLKAVIDVLYPVRKPFDLCSTNIRVTDPFLEELAAREKSNRMGLLSTIIFVRHTTRNGTEISGYIDYSDRLRSENWTPYFEGKKRIWPRITDLGYFNWRRGKSYSTVSQNFKVLVDPIRGLLFQSRSDRKIICVDPNTSFLGDNTTKHQVNTSMYDQVVLYDHSVRRKSTSSA